jgi:hypothetical protein
MPTNCTRLFLTILFHHEKDNGSQVGLESKQAHTGSVAASQNKQKLEGQAQFLGASQNGHKIEEFVLAHFLCFAGDIGSWMLMNLYVQ